MSSTNNDRKGFIIEIEDDGETSSLEMTSGCRQLASSSYSSVQAQICSSWPPRLRFGVILTGKDTVVATSEDVEAAKAIAWERYFYGLLAKGKSLAVSYDLVQATADLPMRLLVRDDAVFLQDGSIEGAAQ